MKRRKIGKGAQALLIALSLILGQMMSALPVAAAGGTLPIAQFVNTEGTAQCGADKTTSTYDGKVTMKIPMATVLAGNEADMKSAGAQGLYPHGRDGKNKIAYISYEVTFPEAVTVGTVAVANKASMINGNGITHKVVGRTVTFRIPLNDVNWQTIYEQYLKDKADPAAHTLDITIPYTAVASNKADAKKFDSEFVTGKGEFSFYPSGMMATFGIGLQTYVSDTASKPFTTGMADACKSNEPQDVNMNGTLEGDLLIGSETEHTKVFESKKDASHDFTGELNVAPIKAQMLAIEQQYQAAHDKIDLSEMNTSFTATFTIPNELKFRKAEPDVVLEGVNDKFEITKNERKGNTVTVTMSLKNADKIKTYADLAAAIKSVDDKLKVTVKEVKFADAAKPDTEYTVNGTVSGTFKAKATNTESGQVINFGFNWAGKQSKAGADVRALDSENIQFTLMYKDDKPQDVSMDGTLEGDLLIGSETEHTKVFESKKDASHDFTGELDVAPIKKQMLAIEQQYQAAHDKVTLSGMSTSFTATITLPKEMEFSKGDPEVVLEGVNDKFEITKSELKGKTVTVTMSLKNADKIKTYEDLAAAIKAVDDKLKVTVKGAKFTDDAKPDTEYTVNGTVSGTFKAKATNTEGGKEINFSFNWAGKQSKDGADVKALDSENIQFTLLYREPQNVSMKGTLEGDLLIGDETEHTKVFESEKDASHDFTGELNVAPIKAQMLAIEQQYQAAHGKINLSDMSTSFTATITLPKEMEFSKADPEVVLEGVNDKFEITKSELKGKTMTVTMSLKNADKIKTYADLAAAIKAVDDKLKVTVKGAKVTDDAKADTEYTVNGTVSGAFKAKATNTESGQEILFNFNWEGKQSKEGADVRALDSENIQFTLLYKEKKPDGSNRPAQPSKPETGKKLSPKTGDASTMPWALALMGGSILALAGAVAVKKRKRA